MKVSIQGIKGAFHEEAAKLYFGNQATAVPQLTFEKLIHSVETEEVDYGIMAIENTISGTIHSNLNLIRSAQLKITGEINHRISQNLAALPGTSLDTLTQVHSHYMAINQCRDFFKEFPSIKLVDSEDTALSMRTIKEKGLHNIGAIGSKLAAEYYDLEIIAEGIETNKNNFTRFLILETKNSHRQNVAFDKASLVFLLPHRKGSLANTLNIMNYHDINLCKIESMPVIGRPWNYLFYLDVVFNKEEDYYNMLDAIRPMVQELNILGEYQSEQTTVNVLI